jgi:hypothetical protein
VLLVACGSSAKKDAPVAQVASGQKVVIKKGVWDAFINYKHWLMPKSYSRPGRQRLLRRHRGRQRLGV